LNYKDIKVSGFYVDFLINNQIVLELKVANQIYPPPQNTTLQPWLNAVRAMHDHQTTTISYGGFRTSV